MIERKFVSQNMNEYLIEKYISENLSRVGHSSTKLQRTPLGEKIIISASRPGLVVGKSGATISKLTKELKEKFNVENPQIELAEVENVSLDARVVAETVAGLLERFGSARFKGIGHKVMTDVMNAGALGVEIKISGKIPSARAKAWRFYQGYLKKSGDIAITGVKKAYAVAKLKSGIIGIQVRIMPPDTLLPDKITFREEATPAAPAEQQQPSAEAEQKEIAEPEAKPKAKPKPRKKKSEQPAAEPVKTEGDEA